MPRDRVTAITCKHIRCVPCANNMAEKRGSDGYFDARFRGGEERREILKRGGNAFEQNIARPRAASLFEAMENPDAFD